MVRGQPKVPPGSNARPSTALSSGRFETTPKTVEFHLAKIYRTLGRRSRTELAARFGSEVHDPAAFAEAVAAG